LKNPAKAGFFNGPSAKDTGRLAPITAWLVLLGQPQALRVQRQRQQLARRRAQRQVLRQQQVLRVQQQAQGLRVLRLVLFYRKRPKLQQRSG
jgi:hypothetical protein